MKILGHRHTGIIVHNFDKMLDFYIGLGLELRRRDFEEGQFVGHLLNAESIEPYVNTKDIVYHGEDNLWTVAAFKYESPYGDGSRPNYGIVNIPSAALIEMSLRSSGFGESTKLGSELDFYDDSGRKTSWCKRTTMCKQA